MSSGPFILVLTGSIGTGKSTTAAMFSEFGVPVWDADSTVRKLYARGGDAVAPVSKLAPQSVIDGAIEKAALRAAISADPKLLEKLESVVHPLVAQDRSTFLDANLDANLVLLDIPLFFETSSEISADAVLVVTTSAEEQRKRVLSRGTMSEKDFELILARQMPDKEKRARADFVIETRTIEQTREAVRELVSKIRAN